MSNKMCSYMFKYKHPFGIDPQTWKPNDAMISCQK